MHKHIVQFFLWLFPILKQAAIQVLAEEIHKIAYPNNPYRRPLATYDRRKPRTRREAVYNVGRSVREAKEFSEMDNSPHGPRLKFGTLDNEAAGNRVPEIGFHDVLLVAFDLKGKSAYQVHTWLADQLPTLAEESYDGEHVHLDDWWIANDERFNNDDRDSAVFVKKDFQAEARELLRKRSLVD